MSVSEGLKSNLKAIVPDRSGCDPRAENIVPLMLAFTFVEHLRRLVCGDWPCLRAQRAPFPGSSEVFPLAPGISLLVVFPVGPQGPFC